MDVKERLAIFGLLAGLTIGMLSFYLPQMVKEGNVNNTLPSINSMYPAQILAAKLVNLPALVRVQVKINGEFFPKKYTCDGENINFAIKLPDNGIYAILMEDPDAPVGNWFHWGLIIWNTSEVPEGLPKVLEGNNFMQTYNDFYYYNVTGGNIKGIGYDGPCPPPGAPHRYFIEVFKLKALPEKPIHDKDELKAFVAENAVAMYVTYKLYGR